MTGIPVWQAGCQYCFTWLDFLSHHRVVCGYLVYCVFFVCCVSLFIVYLYGYRFLSGKKVRGV